jgi:hypothetical protein
MRRPGGDAAPEAATRGTGGLGGSGGGAGGGGGWAPAPPGRAPDRSPAARGPEDRYGWIMRVHANGPNAFGPWGALTDGSIVTFNHSSGVVLPCTTMRWKFGTL